MRGGIIQGVTDASMGPRPCDRGRLGRYNEMAVLSMVRLQWVHGLVTVGDPLGHRQGPSWTRLQWVHGLVTVGDERRLSQGSTEAKASMGPRPCDRGRQELCSCDGSPIKLQWVHGLVTVGDHTIATTKEYLDCASMGPRPCDRGRHSVFAFSRCFSHELQWVHGLLTVGDPAVPERLRRMIFPRFNGSTAF